jgi:putative sterol carrier protein
MIARTFFAEGRRSPRRILRSISGLRAAVGQSAIIQYDLDTPRGLVRYQVKVDNGTCSIEKGTSGEARVTLAMSLSNFVRLMAGVLEAMQALMNGQLEISGDVMFSQNVGNWFKQPDS